MQITAPFDGEIVEVYGVVGNQLGRNVNILRLVAPGRFTEMELNEEDFNGAAIGQRVTLRLASYGNREFQGKVTNIAATADAEKKTRKLFVEVFGDQKLLVPGLTGEAYLVKQERPNAVKIPAAPCGAIASGSCRVAWSKSAPSSRVFFLSRKRRFSRAWPPAKWLCSKTRTT